MAAVLFSDRLPVVAGTSIEALTERRQDVGLTIVSIEPDKAVVAFREDGDLTEFRRALGQYQRGPRINPRTQRPFASTKWDVFEYVEADQMRSWSKADRIGPRLRELAGDEAQRLERNRLYVVDVELWHRGTQALAAGDLDELAQVVDHNHATDERILDQYAGESICLAKVAVRGDKLSRLLELPIVAEVDLPPVPIFDPIQAHRTTRRSFPAPPRPEPDGPRLCILDSGITSNHPLLAANVGHAEAILTADTDPSDQHGHGTMVGGLAVFGNVRACYETGSFASPVTLYSARVLNDHNEFDEERLIINQMRAAIEVFVGPPYDCRVFNLSLGAQTSAFENGNLRQTLWAEALDNLARELKVLLVVAAGNNPAARAGRPDEAESVLGSYPAMILEPEARISDPGTAALAITAGSLVEHDTPGVRHGVDRNDIVRPVAQRNQPSPFTRTGPGVAGAIKPEFVDYGGNLVFSGMLNLRRINKEPGTAVMSFSREPLQRLFAYEVGSSFASPRIARIAAIVWHRLRSQLGRDPDPNLVRAVLATAAIVPEEAHDCLTLVHDHAVVKACGYGRLDEELASESADRRVTLIAQGSVQLDHFVIYEVPIPPEFMAAQGSKRITVGLAFDPPVRRRRQEYLGVHMNFYLIRGKTLNEVINAYRAVGPHEGSDAAIQGACKLTFVPPPQPRGGGYVRSKSTLQQGVHVFKRKGGREYGDVYYLVVRAERKWALAEIETQDYGVAVTLQADDAQLYNIVEARNRQRLRARAQI